MSKEAAAFPTSSHHLEQLQDAVREAAKDSELNINLGEAMLRVGQVEEAVACYQRAIELDPRSDLRALYWEWLGIVREMEGRLEEALEAYFQWLDADPVAINPLDRLATLLVVLNRQTELKLLQSQYTRRCELAPTAIAKESLALYTYVMGDAKQGNIDDIHHLTLTALEENSGSPALRFLLGLLAYEEGEVNAAKHEFERVIELDPGEIWLEQRFALGWSTIKARIMLAKIARQQGRREIALSLLSSLTMLESRDLEGVTEAAELMLEDGRYQELASLLAQTPVESLRIARLKAEGLLGQGRWVEARTLYEHERSALGQRVDPGEKSDELDLSLDRAWQTCRHQRELLSSEIEHLNAEYPGRWQDRPLGASLAILQLVEENDLCGFELTGQLEKLAQRFPASPKVWELLEELLSGSGQTGASKLASLERGKLEHGGKPNFMGWFNTASSKGIEVIGAAFTTEGHPVILEILTELGHLDSDELWGWGGDRLTGCLSLAKSVLKDLDKSCLKSSKALPDLGLPPHNFRLMATRLASTAKLDPALPLDENTLKSISCAILLALLETLKGSSARCRVLVLGQLGLRGNIEGTFKLEELISSLAASGLEWDHLVTARAGSFRLLRCPAELWYARPLTLVDSASELLELKLGCK